MINYLRKILKLILFFFILKDQDRKRHHSILMDCVNPIFEKALKSRVVEQFNLHQFYLKSSHCCGKADHHGLDSA